RSDQRGFKIRREVKVRFICLGWYFSPNLLYLYMHDTKDKIGTGRSSDQTTEKLSPEQNQLFKDKVQYALQQAKSGKSSYRSLDRVAEKYSVDAR
ncbi:MAG: hypothetical protein AAF723_05790, partial [Pseudomonadota bacterium]